MKFIENNIIAKIIPVKTPRSNYLIQVYHLCLLIISEDATISNYYSIKNFDKNIQAVLLQVVLIDHLNVV